MGFDYDISIVIPVYNVEGYLEKCLDSLVKQSFSKSKMEAVLVDDGSTDSSSAICDRYAEQYSFFHVYHIENGGVSAARNFGIENSHGKYIMFLDSDDWITKKTVKALVSFFDEHYDKVDIITYNQMIEKDGNLTHSTHFRYKFINKTGVYDLTDPEYQFFVQSHMNICIKNAGKNNVKFDTSMIFHEDQKFILTNLAKKNKIGFCDKACYVYVKNAGGATQVHSHPYYIFEKTMELWEGLFSETRIPGYVQAFFLHDFNWKLRGNLLWPYQYEGEEFERQKNRIINLIKQVDDDIIANLPLLMPAHQAYIYQLKYGDDVSVRTDENEYTLSCHGTDLMSLENIELYFTRFKVKNNSVIMIGAVKCLAGNFTDDIRLQAVFIGDKKETFEVPLKDSSLSFLASQTKTNKFNGFNIKRSLEGISKIEFYVYLNGVKYPAQFTFPPSSPFCPSLNRRGYICDGMYIKYVDNIEGSYFLFKKAGFSKYILRFFKDILYSYKIGYRNTITRIQAPLYKKKHRIWLYCDSAKTVKDNAYYQFMHDISKNDGVERYYVYNQSADISGWFDDSHKPYLIPYGSLKHRLFALSADKFITSFYGLHDMLSYPAGAMKYFFDLINFDVIYLQHGVLHAHLPTMYSLDRMLLDKEVISTEFEEKNLIDNYCFEEDFLIKCGMPRYDHIDVTKKAEKKILFAPSWRKFLVQTDAEGNWVANEKKFLNSEFYKVTSEFLSNPRLIKLLKDNGYVMDFKLHPNFRCYDRLYSLDGEVVRMAEKTVDEFSYSIFITDFSSFSFDFVFLKRPVLYFVPDKDLFDAGLNHYRELDIPLEDGFGELSTDCEKAIDDIAALIENGCVPKQKYVDRADNLFFPVEHHSEELYKELIND